MKIDIDINTEKELHNGDLIVFTDKFGKKQYRLIVLDTAKEVYRSFNLSQNSLKFEYYYDLQGVYNNYNAENDFMIISRDNLVLSVKEQEGV